MTRALQDTIGCKLLPDDGLDTVMWSNDYPHSACIWPGATRIIAQDLGHLTPEARAKVLCGNVARLYNDGQLPPPSEPPGAVQDLEAWNKVPWHESVCGVDTPETEGVLLGDDRNLPDFRAPRLQETQGPLGQGGPLMALEAAGCPSRWGELANT